MKISRDDISPALARMLATPGKAQSLMSKAGLVIVQIATRSFTTPSLRARPWAPRKTPGNHGLLLKTGMLRRSLRLIASTGNTVTVGSDRVYAALHQFGGIIRPTQKKALAWKGAKHPVQSARMPARPFFPVKEDGELTTEASDRVIAALETAIRSESKM